MAASCAAAAAARSGVRSSSAGSALLQEVLQVSAGPCSEVLHGRPQPGQVLRARDERWWSRQDMRAYAEVGVAQAA